MENSTQLRNQLFIIKNTIESMKGRARYGTYEKFLEHLSIIDKSVKTMADQLNGSIFSSNISKYEKILVPCDDSRYSKKALNEAIEISKRFSSVLYLLTVVDISTIRPPGMLLGIALNKKMKKLSSEISESIILKTNKSLKNKVEFCRKNDVKAYPQIMKGYAVDAILKFALKNNIDLIVMGSRGLSGFGKILTLGSVSRRVSEEANCPVMLVR